MAERSGFFNANNIDGSYDRQYDASDFTDYFSLLVGDGVFVNPANQLQVIAKNGLSVTVKAGAAFIEGCWYILTEDMDVDIPANTSQYAVNTNVCVTLSRSEREIKLKVRSAVSSMLPVNNGNEHDLVLASIAVGVGASQIINANITDRRPNKTYCGYVTGLVDQIDTSDLFQQFTSEFNTWFDDITAKLGTEPATSLQAQVDGLGGRVSDIEDNFLDRVYPVGSIYMSVNNADPSDLFGGTWQRFSQGRVLVGVNEDDTAFNAPQKTGGEKTHTLTINEMPRHNHGASTESAGSHSHSITVGSAGTHSHNVTVDGNGSHRHNVNLSSLRVADAHSHSRGDWKDPTYLQEATNYNSGLNNFDGSWNGCMSDAGWHQHSASVGNAGNHQHSASVGNSGSHSHKVTVNNTGGSIAHNILQPYITCYMWRRTA